MRFFLLLFLWLLALAGLAVATESGSAYEVLRSHGLPIGLLPKGVRDFAVDDDGRFEAQLEAPCVAKFESEMRYNASVAGTISSGQIAGLSGVAAQDLFLWFPVRAIRLDNQTSGIIHFDVGVVDKRFPLSLFESPPDCSPDSSQVILLFFSPPLKSNFVQRARFPCRSNRASEATNSKTKTPPSETTAAGVSNPSPLLQFELKRLMISPLFSRSMMVMMHSPNVQAQFAEERIGEHPLLLEKQNSSLFMENCLVNLSNSRHVNLGALSACRIDLFSDGSFRPTCSIMEVKHILPSLSLFDNAEEQYLSCRALVLRVLHQQLGQTASVDNIDKFHLGCKVGLKHVIFALGLNFRIIHGEHDAAISMWEDRARRVESLEYAFISRLSSKKQVVTRQFMSCIATSRMQAAMTAVSKGPATMPAASKPPRGCVDPSKQPSKSPRGCAGCQQAAGGFAGR
ncbi:hypothetical protein ZIOFF_010948 [Zingiber officinale]|uniref:Uncharacterized protein n=1 Tax=Zingiber officinale TaxID=94328 RepID=A0A8J5HJW4_ZINOF|nr:hypothetical protein ZIOFF_010948 [Zingiber officinale]